jgi:hypothetical protein
MKYTAEQIKPKKYPQNKPSNSIKAKGDYHVKGIGGWTKAYWDKFNPDWIEHVIWFIDIPNAPKELKPLKYPENTPDEDGSYMVHYADNDTWKVRYYPPIKYNGIDYWASVDYFINYCLGREEHEMIKQQSDVLWNSTSLFAVMEFNDTISITDLPERPGGISINNDEFTGLCKRWLGLKGYNIIDPEPLIAPCPNPECGGTVVLEDAYVAGHYKYYFVCNTCGYVSPLADSASEAIRLHNIIAKK